MTNHIKKVGPFVVMFNDDGSPFWFNIMRVDDRSDGSAPIVRDEMSTLSLDDLRDLRYALDETIRKAEK